MKILAAGALAAAAFSLTSCAGTTNADRATQMCAEEAESQVGAAVDMGETTTANALVGLVDATASELDENGVFAVAGAVTYEKDGKTVNAQLLCNVAFTDGEPRSGADAYIG